MIRETGCVILSGRLDAVKHAASLAAQGNRVLLAVPETCLAPEICDTFQWRATEKEAAFFPEGLIKDGLLMPAAAKRYLEEYCLRTGVGLLYGVRPVDCAPHEEAGTCRRLLRLAAKGGLYGIVCDAVFREKRQTSRAGRLCYSVLTGEEERDGFDILTVDMAGEDGGVSDTAECLEKLQQMAMEKYAELKKEKPGLKLGRFAPRAGVERAGEIPFGLEEWENDIISGGRPVGFETGNEFTRDGAGRPMQPAAPPSAALRVRSYAAVKKPVTVCAAEERCDIVIAGGGTAGAMAALYAARGGADTVLIEPEYALGGTSTAGGVSTYWFGNRFRDVEEIDRETGRIMDRLKLERRPGIWSRDDDFHPGVRAFVLQRLCRKAGVKIVYGQLCFGAVCEEEPGKGGGAAGKRVTGIVTTGDAGTRVYRAKAVIDATGDADLAVFAGAGAVYGSERDCVTYWASLAQYTDVNRYRNNFSTMVIEADPADNTRFIVEARRRGGELFDDGRYVSMRESRHVRAKTIVCLKDLMEFRTWPDALYTCYSNYDPKGKLDADIICCGLLPPQARIQIPLSALLPCEESGRRIQGLYVAGKAIGATHNVFPSIRMQPDLMHQGAVLGGLLASCLAEGIVPEQMEDSKRRGWVGQMTGDRLTLPQAGAGDVREAVYRLSAHSRTHWVDMPFLYEEMQMAEMPAVLLADPDEALPPLKKRLSGLVKTGDLEKKELQILLTGCCLWHGDGGQDGEFAKEYADYLLSELKEDVLPKRKGSITCAQLLPDHGVMPEFVYHLNLLGRAGGRFSLPVYEKVLSLLEGTDRDYRDIRSGIFHYIESFAYAAETGGEKEFCGLLRRLLEFPEFAAVRKEETRLDILAERLMILQLILYRALARLGDGAGRAGLEKLSGVSCMAVAVSARMALEREWNAGKRREKIL